MHGRSPWDDLPPLADETAKLLWAALAIAVVVILLIVALAAQGANAAAFESVAITPAELPVACAQGCVVMTPQTWALIEQQLANGCTRI